MKSRISILPIFALCFSALPASAGEPVTKASDITYDSTPSRWRFGAGYAPLLGLKTDFTGLGTFNSTFTAQPLGGGQNYTYDNGFVHVDSSGNAGGQTWNWGYENSSQYNPAGSGTLSYSLTNSLADASTSQDGSSKTGFEAYAYYDMGTPFIAALVERGVTWGFRGGFHYAHISVNNKDFLFSNTSALVDQFDANGIVVPLAPYSGSFSGPGPLINDSPFRAIAPGTQALIAGSRDLDVDLVTLELGAYLDLPITQNFHIMAECGANAGIANGSYDFVSSTSITGLGTVQSSGHDSATRLLPGCYLGLSSVYQIDKQWSILANGRYQYMQGFDLHTNGSSAKLSFNGAYILSLGMLYSF